jgi:uncharacterized membrane protein (DUF106 family)
MAIIDTLFDVLSASIGAIMGAVFAFFLNHHRNRSLATKLIVNRQTLDKIKLENQSLLKQIQDKENTILQMQMQILGTQSEPKKNKNKKKNA